MITIASCQFEVSNNVLQNHSSIQELIKEAHIQNADVAHFPECCLTGYGGIQLKSIKLEGFELVLSSIEEIKKMAARLGIHVILGTHYFIEGCSKPRNSLLVINDRGEQQERYDKRILAGTYHTMDHLYYSAGEEAIIFELKGFKCGLVICHEWRYPELYREYKKLGAELIFHSWFDGGLTNDEYQEYGKAEGELIMGAVKGYAANNYLWVSGSNISSKQSCFSNFVAQPDGQLLNQSPRNVQHVLVTEIDLGQKFNDPSFHGRKRFL